MEKAALRRARILAPAKKILLVLLVGILYYGFVRLTGLRIPCVYFLVSGNYCPGCGITRMFLALGQFDFALAVRNNALVLFLAPFALAFALRRWWIYIKTGHTDPDRPEQIFLIFAAILTVVFWILRNRPEFFWLAPV